jgi:acetyltransferase-like isoleucine patch superfamily enzyme
MDYKETRYMGDANPAWEFYKIKRRLRLFYNTIICHICKLLPPKIKNGLYRSIGVEIGNNVLIAPYVQIDPFFPEMIKLDDYVIIGWGASIFTHEFTQDKVRKGRVHIKKRALIGGFSVIRSGVTVGEHATVAVGSFVNRDIKDYESVGGNPLKNIELSNKK